MKNFISFLDHSPKNILTLVEEALAIKNGKLIPQNIKNKTLGMLFFNPSLRTRVSFEMAMHKFGGKALSLSAGSDLWSLEFQDNVVMDGNITEHVKEGARVLSRYLDALAIRSFAGLKDLSEDLEEKVLRSFEMHSTVPVLSMESATEHPAQCLADIMTIKEKHGDQKLNFVLTWAPHIKPLPMAVAHSAVLAGAYSGCNIIIAHPKGYELSSKYLDHAESLATSLGGSLTITNDQKNALNNADIVYAKNWAPSSLYGKSQSMQKSLILNSDWIVTGNKVKNAQSLMHCLPVRRNLEVSDDALDGQSSIIIDQAENRLWAQSALLNKIFSQ
jgi:N-acetylornithine carbamoyltransferase